MSGVDRDLEPGRPRPHPDRDSRPFWEALANRELRLQRCSGCRALRWPPRAICNRCFDFEATWSIVSERGRLVSWIRTHQVFTPAYRDAIPYIVVQVALEEQPDILMIGGWQGRRDPRAREPVAARFRAIDPDTSLLDWAPTTDD